MQVPGYWDGGIVPSVCAAIVLLLRYWSCQAHMQSWTMFFLFQKLVGFTAGSRLQEAHPYRAAAHQLGTANELCQESTAQSEGSD